MSNVKVTGQRRPRWALWRWFHIPDRARPDLTYLSRLRVVQTPWFGIYVHWIKLPDPFDPHDHPWNFWSFVARGGYTEVRHPYPNISLDFKRAETWERGTIHRVGLYEAHRIADIAPGTVTVVFVGRRRREWGFYQDGQFVPWQQYEAVPA